MFQSSVGKRNLTGLPKNTAQNDSAATVSAPPVQKVAEGMNPAHGHPNHRCDIAVGELLNSKPVAPAINPIVPAPVKADSTHK